MPPASLPAGDAKLVQIVDAALTDVARRSGSWLTCHVGCTQCCVGVFAINQLDAARLRNGLADLEKSDPVRAKRLRGRVRSSVTRLERGFPGNAATGVLGSSEADLAVFEEFGNEEVCPVLDPETGKCDLYASRPMTCRVFGPPVRSEDGLGVCELCFVGATEEEVARCEMIPDPEGLEPDLVEEAERRSAARGDTIVAFALR